LAGRIDFEIVYVDDGSADNSATELAGLRSRNQCGQSAALRTGVAAARAAWIAILDGDGQNDPADIPALLEARDHSAAPKLWMIAGVRRRRRDSMVKSLSSRIANGIRRRVLRDATTDIGCGLKLFRRDAFLALPFFDHMHRFLPALIRRAGGATLLAYAIYKENPVFIVGQGAGLLIYSRNLYFIWRAAHAKRAG
jgi:dolichol-phosphate mannosyltransferase